MEAYVGPEASETSKYLRMFDRVFDCLNVCSVGEDLRKRKPDLLPYTSLDDPRFEFLLVEFLGWLDYWKRRVEGRQGFSKTEKSAHVSVQTDIQGIGNYNKFRRQYH